MAASTTSGVNGAVAQIAVAAVCMATAMLIPPVRGSFLAVPIGGSGSAATINVALAHGGSVEGAGPLSGWIVLRGERARLAGPLRSRGVVLLAGASWMCRS